MHGASLQADSSVTSALEVNFNVMRSINSRFTYLLSYFVCFVYAPVQFDVRDVDDDDDVECRSDAGPAASSALYSRCTSSVVSTPATAAAAAAANSAHWRTRLPATISRYEHYTKLLYGGPVSTWMGDCLREGEPSRYDASQLGRLSLLPSVGW